MHKKIRSAAAIAAVFIAAAAAHGQAAQQTRSAQTISTQSGPVRVELLAQLDNPWGMALLPRPQFVAPLHSWNPSISPSGMAFYTGNVFSAWRGNALLGGLSSEALIRLTLNGGKVAGVERIEMQRRIRDVAQAHDGAVLLLSDGDNADLLRLTSARP